MKLKIRTTVVRALGVAVLILGTTAMSAEAGPITFDFTTGSTISNQPFGNSMTYTVGGITVTATAWTFNTNLTPDAFAAAGLDRYSGNGLGVCNTAEGQNCSSPEHQIDNNGVSCNWWDWDCRSYSTTDFVLFRFSQAVSVSTVGIKTYSDDDLDASYWLGSITAAQLNGATLGSGNSLTNMASMLANDCSGSCSSTTKVDTINSGFVTSLLFGARLDGTGDSYDDYFKIQNLTVNPGNSGQSTPPVPEPASMTLLGTGLLGLAGQIRKRLKK